jgi:putative hydrolase of the HAD superfamily
MFSWFKRGKDIKLICFDMDNTLCDFATAETETEAYMAELISRDIKKLQSKMTSKNKKHGTLKNPCSPFTILRFFNDVKKEHLYKDLAPMTYSRMIWFKKTLERLGEELALGVSLSNMIMNATFYEKEYWVQINKRLKNYPSTLSTLGSLKSSGLKLATITDSDGLAGMKDYRIKLLGLDKYFDYIITGDNIGLNKPAVENWNKLLSLSGLKGKQCIMVGDHPDVDLLTAKKLGFITVWTKENLNIDLNYDYVDYEIRDIKETLDILNKVTK